MQLLDVTALNPEKPEGRLMRYERLSLTDPWMPVGEPIPVVLGKNGVTSDKQEGDGKSPVGCFSLGTAFGDSSHRHYVKKMPYLLIEKGMEWVDDPSSSFYNQLILPDFSGPRTWKSSEKMAEMGSVYALGIVVAYNTDPIIRGKGSAIFIHIEKDFSEGTAGCIAMKENALRELVLWLDPLKTPKVEIGNKSKQFLHSNFY